MMTRDPEKSNDCGPNMLRTQYLENGLR